MPNLVDTPKDRTYDAIVIGSGASGGWAAKELCDKGLKTLILERGRNVKNIKDYPPAGKSPWQFEYRGSVPLEGKKDFQLARNAREETFHWAIRDDEQPFIQEKPFRWFRGYHVGGKSLLWARQTQRWSDFDFEGPARDGFAFDGPIRYKDLEPWYSHVEKFAGIAGNKDGLPELPDSECMPGFEMSCVENHFKETLQKNYSDRHLIQGRCAHITDPQPIHLEQGRHKCQNQALCIRGCVFGAYFSSNASTLPWAMKTNKLTLRPFSVVHSVIYDDKKGRASGVRVIDGNTKETVEYYARIIFVNASALNTNLILLNSTSARFPNGLGNDSGVLGKYVAWHNYRGKGNAEYEGLKDKYEIPQLIISCEWTENDDKMVEDYVQQTREMFEKAGFTNISAVDTKTPPGADIHEMGGVRMGLDPKTSMLNAWNQLHLCKNVIVTD